MFQLSGFCYKPILTRRGGDSSRVAGLLVDVCQIQSSADAFAAIRRDGTVPRWPQVILQ